MNRAEPAMAQAGTAMTQVFGTALLLLILVAAAAIGVGIWLATTRSVTVDPDHRPDYLDRKH